MEHYESKSDPKYLHYQERLNNLLARKDVITLLNVGSPSSVARLKPNQIIKKMQEEVAQRQKIRSHQVNMYMIHCFPETKEIDEMLVRHRSDNTLASVKVKENLRRQESDTLAERAEARRRKSGTPTIGITRALSINSARNSKIEKYQEQIENIVEKCVEERDTMVKEVKKKYKEEIKQVRLIGGTEDIITQVINEMKQNLKSEVKEIERSVREKKKQMIEEIKGNFIS